MNRFLKYALLTVAATVFIVSRPLNARADENPVVPARLTGSPPPIVGAVSDPRWQAGAHVAITDEFNFRKGIEGQATDAYVLMDSRYLYVGWIAHQSSQIVAQTVTNDAALGSDDWVSIFLWPGDAQGYAYSFTVTPLGTHTATSSENTAFAPRWDSAGRKTPNGYEATMRIPLSILHTAKGAWHIAFLRNISAPGLLTVWPFDPVEKSAGDVRYSATLQGVDQIAVSHPSKPQPRLQPYGLVQIASAAANGSTSRAGLDFSIPEGSGAFYGTIHPDYSNVEVDQQTIAPTEFARYYNEVRPFFTQGANFYNATGITDLYTPSIPTPRYGYAFERSRGGLNVAGFDAVGDGRDDNAQVLSYSTNNQTLQAAFQRTSVNTTTGLSDLTQSGSISIGNGKHFTLFGAMGEDSGTNVASPSENQYRVVGAQVYGPNDSLGLNLISIGKYYNPVDGYIPNPGVAGYLLSAGKTLLYGANAKIQSVSIFSTVDGYHDSSGALNQVDVGNSISITNRHKLTLSLSSGNHEFLVGSALMPFNSNYVSVSDQANPMLNGYATYTYGRFLNGFARDFDVSTNATLRGRYTFSIERYQTVFTSDLMPDAVQTLYRFGLYAQFTKNLTAGAGLRTINGEAAGLAPTPVAHDTNLTLTLQERMGSWHFYAVYGDPNAVTTSPSFTVKLVKTIGADEGT